MGSIFQKPPNNYQYLVGIENQVDYEVDAASITNPTAETTLHNLIIPASSLARNGQRVYASSAGTSNLSAGSGPLRVRVNTTQIFQVNLVSAGALRGWHLAIELHRKNTSLWTLVRCTHAILQAPTVSGASSQGANFLDILAFNFDSQIEIAISGDLSAGTGIITAEESFLSLI